MSEDNSISVCVRVRPLNEKEKKTQQTEIIKPVGNAVQTPPVSSGSVTPGMFAFDRVFGVNSETAEVYSAMCAKLTASAVQGFNGTVFAYGQTSSGKTHTIRGTEQCPGVLPLAILDMFEQVKRNADRKFLIRVCYIEIYNEDIKDLLTDKTELLKVRRTQDENFEVVGLTEHVVVSPDEVFHALNVGDPRRATGETNMNAHSSRSHAIFRITIESVGKEGELDEGSVRISTLNFVDLAGSERQSKTGAQGTRLKEAVGINKSLLTLSNVIGKLSEEAARQQKLNKRSGGLIGAIEKVRANSKPVHIPYRDSNLTRILKNALGGNSMTLAIIAITPAEIHLEESISSLRFATKCKEVVCAATLNETVSEDGLLKRYQAEVAKLTAELESLQGGSKDEADDSEKTEEAIQNAIAQEREEHNKQVDMLQRKVDNLMKLVINDRRGPSEIDARKTALHPQSAMPQTRNSSVSGRNMKNFFNFSKMVINRNRAGTTLADIHDEVRLKRDTLQPRHNSGVIIKNASGKLEEKSYDEERVNSMIRDAKEEKLAEKCDKLKKELALLTAQQWRSNCALKRLQRESRATVAPKAADGASEASTDEAMKTMSTTMRNAVIQRYVSMIKHAKETHAWNDREHILTTRLNSLEDDVAQAEREIDMSRRQTEELQQKLEAKQQRVAELQKVLERVTEVAGEDGLNALETRVVALQESQHFLATVINALLDKSATVVGEVA